MSTQPTTAEIARRWELWAEYVGPYGAMGREEWEEMAVSDREALIVETFGARGDADEDARDVAMAQAALAEWEMAGRPTVSLETLKVELGL